MSSYISPICSVTQSLIFLHIDLAINVAHPVFLMHTQSPVSGYATDIYIYIYTVYIYFIYFFIFFYFKFAHVRPVHT